MATSKPHTKPSLRDELASYNDDLEACLRSHVGMSLKTFKVIKALTQFFGSAAGIYAMYLGADPLLALAMTTGMVLGPEGLEQAIEAHGGGSE